MHRRRFLTATTGCTALLSLSGCAGILPATNAENPDFPGGTLVIENTGDSPLDVTISVAEDRFSATLDATVPAGETVVERRFVTASEGDIATLTARIGADGEPTTFEFLPAGGTNDSPPEVARLSIENAVEESATWTAVAGTDE